MHSLNNRSYAERLRTAVADTCAAAEAYYAQEAAQAAPSADRSDPRIVSPEKAAAWLKRAERRERYARLAWFARHGLAAMALTAGLMLLVR